MPAYHIAQFNAAPLIAPIDDPRTKEFADAIDAINALAEASPGFVWRMQTEDGDATGIRIDDNPQMLVNMSVWEDIDALYKYAYKSDHASFFKRRREWFNRWDRPSPVLWWIPEGYIPTLDDALERLSHLEAEGPTPYAFNFKTRFTAEEAAVYVPSARA